MGFPLVGNSRTVDQVGSIGRRWVIGLDRAGVKRRREEKGGERTRKFKANAEGNLQRGSGVVLGADRLKSNGRGGGWRRESRER